MTISRRNVIKLGIGATALLAGGAGPLSALTASTKDKIHFGLQLYSVRKACKKNMPGVLKKVAAMGYEGVEFSGYHGFLAEEFADMLNQAGLKCCGTHIHHNALSPKLLQETINFNKAIGNRYLIVSTMPPSYMESVESIKETAAFYNNVAKILREHDMLVGYHSHAGDFKKVPGTDKTAWEMLFENLDPQVVMQLDVGNCQAAGCDPVAILKDFPGRATTIHLKEYGENPQAMIGEGKVDWKSVLDICKSAGGTQWLIVEYEHAPDSFENVERCLKYLLKAANR